MQEKACRLQIQESLRHTLAKAGVDILEELIAKRLSLEVRPIEHQGLGPADDRDQIARPILIPADLVQMIEERGGVAGTNPSDQDLLTDTLALLWLRLAQGRALLQPKLRHCI